MLQDFAFHETQTLPQVTSTRQPRAHDLRVLVVGPVRADGGLATVARQSTSIPSAPHVQIAVCDVSKDTPTDRSLQAGMWSQARKWGRLVTAMTRFKPDVVHFHTCSFGTFYRTMLDAHTCRMLRRPYVLHVHGGHFADFVASQRGPRRAAVEAVMCHAARVIVLSQGWKQRLERSVPGPRYEVVPNGVNIPKRNTAATDRGQDILFVGDFSETKRLEDLIVAFAALPSQVRRRHTLRVVGEGSPQRRDLLCELATRLDVGGQVCFEGHCSPESVTRLMRDAALLVLPSRAEGLPLVLLEAMSVGLPFVATRVGAVAEIAGPLADELLVLPGDTLALTRRIQHLLEVPDRCREIGEALFDRVAAHYAVERFQQGLLSVWTDVTVEAREHRSAAVPKLAVTTLRSLL